MHAASAATAGRDRPRFRQDLVAELVEAQGDRFIDVMAPEGGDVFRFYEVEYSLACGMDGERDIAGIVRWAQDELGLTPALHEVRAVIATLGELGFIERPEEPTDRAQVRPTDPERVPGAMLAQVGPAETEPMLPSPEVEAEGTQRTLRPSPGTGAALGMPGRSTRPTPAPPDDSDEPEISSEISSEVSIDLADHIEVGPDDVKEAVRASKVMSAVDVPADVLETINDRPTAPASALESPFAPPEISRPQISRPSQASRPPEASHPPEVSRSPESAWLPEPKSDARIAKSPQSRAPAAGRPPVELPPPVISDKHPTSTVRTTPPRPSQSTNSALVLLFLLVILAAAAFFVWKYVLNKPSATTSSTVPAPPAVKPPPPPAPPPPPPTAKIALETPPPTDVTLPRGGQIETILGDKTAVKEGDVVMRLVGDKPIEAELGALGRDQKRMQDLIDAATRRRDAAHTAGNKAVEAQAQADITEKQKTLALKQNGLAAKTAELDNFMIHAPRSGTFSPAVKSGQKVAADAVVAKVQRDPVPSATFKLGNTRAFAGNGSVELAIGKGEQRVTCTIADVQSDGVKVACPVDPALTDGTDVTLNVPASSAPEAPPPEAPGAAAPSGTAPTEGGSAAAGAAAPPAGQPAQPTKAP